MQTTGNTQSVNLFGVVNSSENGAQLQQGSSQFTGAGSVSSALSMASFHSFPAFSSPPAISGGVQGANQQAAGSGGGHSGRAPIGASPASGSQPLMNSMSIGLANASLGVPAFQAPTDSSSGSMFMMNSGSTTSMYGPANPPIVPAAVGAGNSGSVGGTTTSLGADLAEQRKTRMDSVDAVGLYGKAMNIAIVVCCVGSVLSVLTLGLQSGYILFVLLTSAGTARFLLSLVRWIMAHDAYHPEMKRVSDAIREGSESYLNTQYTAIAQMACVAASMLALVYLFRESPTEAVIGRTAMSITVAFAFLLGAFCSAAAGYVGMWISVRVNVRVSLLASRYSYPDALLLCFRGGAVSAALSAGLCIVGISLLYLVTYTVYVRGMGLPPGDLPPLLCGYGFGAAFVALFMQLGGGIYTKGADVGADMCGKIEINLPEDDCRNPAVIADLVGDNVGDCAGSMADVFESISGEIIGTMILAASLTAQAQIENESRNAYVFFPLVIHTLDLIISGIGIMSMRVRVRPRGGARSATSGWGPMMLVERLTDVLEGVASLSAVAPGARNTSASTAGNMGVGGGGGATGSVGSGMGSGGGGIGGSAGVGVGFGGAGGLNGGGGNVAGGIAGVGGAGGNGEEGRSAAALESGSMDSGSALGAGMGSTTADGDEDPLVPMKRGYLFSTLIAVVLFCITARLMLHTEKAPAAWYHFAACGLFGIATSYALILITQYYTDYKYAPVRRIALASATGHGTNVIAGISVGLESCLFPALVICCSLLVSYYLGYTSGLPAVKSGIYGTAVCTMGMLSTAVYILSMNNFGPIADNAGGIVEMSEQPRSVRVITDRLDAVGNITKAASKGYAVGGSALASFVLFQAFMDEVSAVLTVPFTTINLARVECLCGGIIAITMIMVFAGWAMESVGRTAQEVVWEVRRQLQSRPGILNFTQRADYAKCVAIVTKSSLKEMRKPALMALSTPVLVGIVFKVVGSIKEEPLLVVEVLGAFMLFATMTGLLMAIFLDNAGGAWDNAKKFIESQGKKGTEEHKAAVTGDTVGDPFKDTAGPSLHVILTTMSTTILVLGPLFVSRITSGGHVLEPS